MLRRIESGISAKSLEPSYLSWVKSCAVQLGLKGVAFIKSDGSVKVIAEGEDKNLTVFAKKIGKYNLLSPLENFYVKWEETIGEFKEFAVTTGQ